MSHAWALALVLGTVVVAGASVQRLTGMGFALVAAPGLVLLLGPSQGVLLSNLGTGAISALGLITTWRLVRIRAMVPLVLAGVATVPLGLWVAARLPDPWLLTGIGVSVCVAVTCVLSGVRVPALRARRGAVAAGALSGFMNSSAGVGGPAVSLYAVNAGWTMAEFVPNAQFYGVIVNAVSIAGKDSPALSRIQWAAFVAALAAGAVIGRVLARHTSERTARRVVLSLALGGGVVTLVKGLLAM